MSNKLSVKLSKITYHHPSLTRSTEAGLERLYVVHIGTALITTFYASTRQQALNAAGEMFDAHNNVRFIRW